MLDGLVQKLVTVSNVITKMSQTQEAEAIKEDSQTRFQNGASTKAKKTFYSIDGAYFMFKKKVFILTKIGYKLIYVP